MAEWIQIELGELDIQITKTNDRQVYKIWCEGKGASERIWEAKKKWEEEGVAHWKNGDPLRKGEREQRFLKE